MTATLVRALERFLLPNACVACGGAVEAHRPDRLICRVCLTRPRGLAGGCPRCGGTLPPVGPCRLCGEWHEAFRWARSAVWLGHEARALVHHLKYDGCPDLAEEVGALMAGRLRRPERGWLVPVPLGPARLRARGYNQAERIARELGRRWGLPLTTTSLRRQRNTPTQTALTPEARLANMAGAFAAGAPPRGTGPSLDANHRAAIGRGGGVTRTTPDQPASVAILVDDVLTTGATLNAAATALHAAGWRTIGAVTFARALSYDVRVAASA